MSEPLLRLLLFLLLVVLLGAAEWAWPRHAAMARRRRRWPVNFGLGLLGVLAVRLLLPWLAVDAAIWARSAHAGLLYLLRTPAWPAAAIAFVGLDLVIYAQHRLMHRVGWLWRLHRVHHTDVALDVSSAVRFHPLEILFSMAVKVAAVVTLGAAPTVVVTFEIVLSSFALATHANVALPIRLDRALRWVFVTPDMHRIHHSVLHTEHDRNFGFHVSWWDRLFGSYLAAPRSPPATLALGLEQFREDRDQGLLAVLVQPVHKA